MKHLLLCICLIFTNISFAQSYNIGLNATVIKNFEGFKENETVTISHIIKEVDEKPYLMKEKKENYFLLINNKTIEIPPQFDKYLRVNIKTPQDLWNYKIITDVIPELSIAGTQYELREEVEEEALDYINYLKEHNLVFNDPYLETYLYSLVTSIAPVNISDGRPGNVNIIILDSPTLNACIYPNGTIVINTGLLANLHTEDELVAILAHEIAHFIADHSIQNIHAEINRKKRAEFWSGLAVGLTAIGEGIAAANNPYYIPGAATASVALLSYSISKQVINRLGMEYNHKQEEEADQIAKQILTMLNYDPNALSSALDRIRETMTQERNNALYFASYTHPALIRRINKAGIPESTEDPLFEKIVSFAVSNTAIQKYENKRFRESLRLVEQNIKNKVATYNDYLLYANNLLNLYNTDDKINDALESLKTAKSIDPDNINSYKTEALIYLRKQEFLNAKQQLRIYKDKLLSLNSKLETIKDSNTWKTFSQQLSTEINWASNMELKLKDF